MRNLTLLVILMAGFACSFVPGAVDAAPGQLPNLFCPVTPDEPAEAEFWLEHDGQRIHFCCSKCKRRFAAEPEAFHVADKSKTEEHHGHEHDQPAAQTVAGHNPATDHALRNPPPVKRLLSFIGKLHPISVHFPIALLMVAGLAEVVFMIRHNPIFRSYARFCLFLGWVSGLAAGSLGWINAATSSRIGTEIQLLQLHRSFALALLVVSGIALGLSSHADSQAGRTRVLSYRLFLFAALILTGLVGHLGGSLVFGPTYLNW